MWILIRWLCQKQADLDLKCFQQKRINLGSAGQWSRGINPNVWIEAMGIK